MTRIKCNLEIFLINHKHSKRFSSIFLQARAKRVLYDTSVMIKEDKNNVLTFNQDLAGSSRDVEGSRGKISKAKFHRELSRDRRGTSREKAESHKLPQSSRNSHGSKTRDLAMSKSAMFRIFCTYKRPITLPQK